MSTVIQGENNVMYSYGHQVRGGRRSGRLDGLRKCQTLTWKATGSFPSTTNESQHWIIWNMTVVILQSYPSAYHFNLDNTGHVTLSN